MEKLSGPQTGQESVPGASRAAWIYKPLSPAFTFQRQEKFSMGGEGRAWGRGKVVSLLFFFKMGEI